MFKKIISCNNLIMFLLINSLFILIFLSSNNAQENYMLSEADFSGVKLLKQSHIHWTINNKNDMLMGLRQKWNGNDENQGIFIDYCKFNNEAEAFISTAYAAVKSNAAPFIWGSFNGSIIADGSWVALDGSAIYFVRGNIGVKIFKPVNFRQADIQLLSSMSLKIADKIDSHLSPDVKTNEKIAKNNQIPMTEFDAMTSIKILDTYSSGPTLDSKWIIDSGSFALGIRKEWKNANGNKANIDICQFDSVQDAEKASQIRSNNSYLYDRIIDLEDLKLLDSMLQEWKEKRVKGLPDKSFSVIGIKGNIAVHFYLFNKSGIDTSLFPLLFEELSLKM